MWAPICDLGKEKEIKSMKIKRKVQKNLPQLIEWAMENDIKDTVFLTKAYSVGFDMHGFIYFNSSTTIPLDTMFTVEVEEEITEDTVIPEILTIYNKGISHLTNNKNLNGLIKTNLKSAYILNDDLTMTLIWTHEKGLVE